MSNNNTEHPKINIPIELTQLDIDIKAELEKGYEWNEAANRVHDRYKQERLAKEQVLPIIEIDYSKE